MYAFNSMLINNHQHYFCLPVEVDDDRPQRREEEVAQSLEDVASSLAHLSKDHVKLKWYNIFTN